MNPATLTSREAAAPAEPFSSISTQKLCLHSRSARISFGLKASDGLTFESAGFRPCRQRRAREGLTSLAAARRPPWGHRFQESSSPDGVSPSTGSDQPLLRTRHPGQIAAAAAAVLTVQAPCRAPGSGHTPGRGAQGSQDGSGRRFLNSLPAACSEPGPSSLKARMLSPHYFSSASNPGQTSPHPSSLPRPACGNVLWASSGFSR